MLLKILGFLLAIVVVAVLVALAVGYFYLSAPKYRGPVSDHFDGTHFFNPDGKKACGFPELFKWITHREQGPWETTAETRYGPRPLASRPPYQPIEAHSD